MTTGNEPTIEEQIICIRNLPENELRNAILASLEKLAALERPVPVEPDSVTNSVRYHDPYGEVRKYIDSLQSALQRAQEERDMTRNLLNGVSEQFEEEKERRAKTESLNRRMVEQYRDLVVAAEKAAAMQIAEQWELQEALAKLEES